MGIILDVIRRIGLSIVLPGQRVQKTITIQTRRGTPVANVQEFDLTPFYLRQIEETRVRFEKNATIEFVNSASPIYNCHGLTFASKRSAIYDAQEVNKILDEDDYIVICKVTDVRRGDIIVYYSSDGDAEHSGLVIGALQRLPIILSKWGYGRSCTPVYPLPLRSPKRQVL
jgi:hypothetical protein